MATTKEYKDLTPAAEIDSAALVALAQPGKSELETTTVEDLSAAVADTLQNGALAELESAVSLGKRELAKRLQEKGSDGASENETLIQLADRLNNLVIDGERTNILGPIVSSADPESIPANRTPFNFRFLNDGYLAISAGANLYLVPPGQYNDVDDMIASAAASVSLQNTTPTQAFIGRSQDGNTLICWTGGDYFEVYSVDYDTPSISFVKKIEGISVSSNQPGVTISNDQQLIAYNYQGRPVIALVEKVSQTADVSAYSDLAIDIFFDEPSNRIFYMQESRGTFYATYQVTEGVVTVTNKANIFPNIGFFVPQARIIVYSATDNNTDWKDLIFHPKLYVCELANDFNRLEITLNQILNDDTSSSYIYAGNGPRIFCGALNFPVLPKENGQFLLLPPAHEACEIVYDSSAHTLSKKNNFVSAIPSSCSNGTSSYLKFALGYTKNNEILTLFDTTSDRWQTFYNIRKNPVSDIKMLGQRRTINSVETLMLLPFFPKDRIDAGYYDVQTNTIALEPEAEQ